MPSSTLPEAIPGRVPLSELAPGGLPRFTLRIGGSSLLKGSQVTPVQLLSGALPLEPRTSSPVAGGGCLGPLQSRRWDSHPHGPCGPQVLSLSCILIPARRDVPGLGFRPSCI